MILTILFMLVTSLTAPQPSARAGDLQGGETGTGLRVQPAAQIVTLNRHLQASETFLQSNVGAEIQ